MRVLNLVVQLLGKELSGCTNTQLFCKMALSRTGVSNSKPYTGRIEKDNVSSGHRLMWKRLCWPHKGYQNQEMLHYILNLLKGANFKSNWHQNEKKQLKTMLKLLLNCIFQFMKDSRDAQVPLAGHMLPAFLRLLI